MSTSPRICTDVIVVGAGPAGCAAATVLAEAGHAVLLVDRSAGTRRALAESIPPSASRLLVELGMDRAVATAGFQPWTGNTVWWAGAPPRIETFAADATGYQVERGRFDAVLRDVAVGAGAQLLTGVVRDVDLPLVTVETGDGLMQATAPWILDCSGRAGVIARKGFRVPEPSHRTVALAGVWRATTPWPDEQEGHTLVASHADGWAWSVPVARDRRYVTVMVDPERSHLTRGAAALKVYQAELAKVGPFAGWLTNAHMEEGPWGADASLYGTRQHAGPGFLQVGDAATFIDPLSSFGVKKALASGWLAGVVVNTLLTAPEMQDNALAFFEARERAIAADLVDRLGHGTAVAAAIREKAPEVELLAVKVFDRRLVTTGKALVDGITWSAERRVDLVNLSLGTSNQEHLPALAAAVAFAEAQGAIVVAAAPQPGAARLPGGLPGVVAVDVDWMCPRDECLVTVGDDGAVRVRASGYPRPIPGVPPEQNVSGLSFAVVNASGFLALLLQHAPGRGMSALVRACSRT